MSAKQKARISRGETTLAKLLPLVFLLVIFFNKLPFVPIFSGLSLENLITGILFLFIAGAFAFEMNKTRGPKGESNFGTIILAVFVIASLLKNITNNNTNGKSLATEVSPLEILAFCLADTNLQECTTF